MANKMKAKDSTAGVKALAVDVKAVERSGKFASSKGKLLVQVQAWHEKFIAGRIQGMEIKTPAELENAGLLFREIDSRLQAVADLENTVCKPIYSAWRNAKDQFSPARTALESAKRIIANAMGAFRAREKKRLEEEAAKERERLNAQAEKAAKANGNGKGGNGQAASAPALFETEVEVKQPTAVSGVKFSERWTFDITKEDQIPRQYLKVDGDKIRGAIAAGARNPDIPGINIRQETTAGRK